MSDNILKFRPFAFVFSIIFLIIVTSTVAQTNRKVVCYYGSWTTYRPDLGKFYVTDIDPFLCTHIIYSFFDINTNNIVSFDPYLDFEANYGKGNIKKFIELKNQNPNLKLMAAIGGWNADSIKFSLLAADPALRAQFAQNVLSFLKSFKFDGLDVDWEYPNQRGGRPMDYTNFPLFLKDLSNVLKPNGLLLSVAVGATENSASLSYNIPEVNKYVDFINLMTYDLHGSWESYTGLHTALYAGSGDPSIKLSIDASVKYWISAGASRDKLILGMATYGRSFKLNDINSYGVNAPANGPGAAGPWTGNAGFMGFNEICYQKNSMYTFYDSIRGAVYSKYDQNQSWIGYDDTWSIGLKANYVIVNQLGGAMFWSIDSDDFRGICNINGKYPLIKKVASIINGGVVPATTTTIAPISSTKSLSTTTTTTQKTTSTTKAGSTCNFTGYQRDPVYCNVFYRCVYGIKYTYTCPAGTSFDTNLNICNWSYAVTC